MAILINDGAKIDTRYSDAIVVSNDGGSTWNAIRKGSISKVSSSHTKGHGVTNPDGYTTKVFLYGPEDTPLFSFELQKLDTSSEYSNSQGAVSPWDLGTPASLQNALNEINSWL